MLEQLLLGFRLLPGLALFELLLGLASLTFLLFILLLLLVIFLLLHLAADGLWSANVAEEVHHGLGDFLVLAIAIVGLRSSHILPEKLRRVVSVGQIELKTILGNSKRIDNDLIIVVPLSLQLDVFIELVVLLLLVPELLLFHLGEHLIADLDEEAVLAGLDIRGRRRQ